MVWYTVYMFNVHCYFLFTVRIYDSTVTSRISRSGKVPTINNRRWLPARWLRSRPWIVYLSAVRDHARCPANRYVLINAPLPHSPGAITAIITGSYIFPARGLHTRRRMEADETRRRAITPSWVTTVLAPIVHRARLRSSVRVNAITSRYSSVLSLAIIGKWRGNACAWQCWKRGGRNELQRREPLQICARFNFSSVQA